MYLFSHHLPILSCFYLFNLSSAFVLFSSLDQKAYFSTIVLFIRDSRYIFINFSVGRVRHRLPPRLRFPFCLSTEKRKLFSVLFAPSTISPSVPTFRHPFDVSLISLTFDLRLFETVQEKIENVNAKREYFRRGTTIDCDSVRDFMRKGSARIRYCFFFYLHHCHLIRFFFRHVSITRLFNLFDSRRK